ncbi:MAG TPA: methyltransferase domain-containing protein [Rhizomicrobium sp.]|jgi:ubiquinone/menaquinone biosynthesis C-methylase UbiE|nr:methyltransferase domain-containing protein [Rhizomicrobium sp.]
MTINAQQIEYWNGLAGERWSKAQDRIDHHLGLITEALLALAAPKEGERVLDIGCGGGTTALILRERVGPEGAVTGIDISAPNLALARARAHAGMADVAFLKTDAATYEFEPTFNLAFSRFGVMFFDDPAVAFANLRTALVKDGRLVFVCWRTFKENEWAFAPYEAALDLLPPQEAMDAHAPGPFAFADRERLMSILERSGFRDIAVKPLDTTVNMGATVDDAVTEALTIGPLARAAAELDEATREKIRARIRPVIARHQTSYGIVAPAAVWLVSARR